MNMHLERAAQMVVDAPIAEPTPLETLWRRARRRRRARYATFASVPALALITAIAVATSTTAGARRTVVVSTPPASSVSSVDAPTTSAPPASVPRLASTATTTPATPRAASAARVPSPPAEAVVETGMPSPNPTTPSQASAGGDAQTTNTTVPDDGPTPEQIKQFAPHVLTQARLDAARAAFDARVPQKNYIFQLLVGSHGPSANETGYRITVTNNVVTNTEAIGAPPTADQQPVIKTIDELFDEFQAFLDRAPANEFLLAQFYDQYGMLETATYGTIRPAAPTTYYDVTGFTLYG